MKAINGIGMLCALGLLCGDAIADASISKVVFHFALLAVNLVFYMAERGD